MIRLVAALVFTFNLVAAVAFAAERAKVSMNSEALGRDIGFSILLPDAYKSDTNSRFPVIYALGGWYADSTWLFYGNHSGLDDFLKKFTDQERVIIVNFGLPNDWYYDAPRVPANKYGTFVTRDLVRYVDQHYRTLARRDGRAIMGFSSGGHGALLLGFQHPELYGAVGAVYGCPDLSRYKNSNPTWNLPRDLGPYNENRETWERFSIARYVPGLKGKNMAIWFGVGLSDELLPDNRQLSRQMKQLGIEHTYHEAPGGHGGPYTAVGAKECLNFFAKHLQHGN